MRKHSDYDYIMQMISYCNKVNLVLEQAKLYSGGLSDELIVDALAMNIGQIGEQVSSDKLSKELQAKYDLPWAEIKGFRNKAYHNYGTMDSKLITDIAIHYVPDLLSNLLKIKDDLENENNDVR